MFSWKTDFPENPHQWWLAFLVFACYPACQAAPETRPAGCDDPAWCYPFLRREQQGDGWKAVGKINPACCYSFQHSHQTRFREVKCHYGCFSGRQWETLTSPWSQARKFSSCCLHSLGSPLRHRTIPSHSHTKSKGADDCAAFLYSSLRERSLIIQMWDPFQPLVLRSIVSRKVLKQN